MKGTEEKILSKVQNEPNLDIKNGKEEQNKLSLLIKKLMEIKTARN